MLGDTMSELTVILEENIGISTSNIRALLQTLVNENKLSAYISKVNKKTTEETEDEIIFRIKKGLSLTPIEDLLSHRPTYSLKDSKTGAEYNLFLDSYDEDIDDTETTYDTCIIERLSTNFDPRKATETNNRAVKFPEEMVIARLKINYEKVWDYAQDICVARRGSLTLEARDKFKLDQEPLLKQIYEFVKGS